MTSLALPEDINAPSQVLPQRIDLARGLCCKIRPSILFFILMDRGEVHKHWRQRSSHSDRHDRYFVFKFIMVGEFTEII